MLENLGEDRDIRDAAGRVSTTITTPLENENGVCEDRNVQKAIYSITFEDSKSRKLETDCKQLIIPCILCPLYLLSIHFNCNHYLNIVSMNNSVSKFQSIRERGLIASHSR